MSAPGPVGMLTALALAQTGREVTVLEQEPHIINSPRAAVYFPSTLIILEELGILDELNEIGFQNRTFGTHIPEFSYSSVVTTEPIEGIPYDYQLHAGQHDVARVAMEHAQKLGVEVCSTTKWSRWRTGRWRHRHRRDRGGRRPSRPSG